jgi:hypothetical protein
MVEAKQIQKILNKSGLSATQLRMVIKKSFRELYGSLLKKTSARKNMFPLMKF